MTRDYNCQREGNILVKPPLLPRIQGLGGTYVTVYEKTRHMGFFVKIKFDVYLISSSLELTYLQSLRPIACFALEIARFVCDPDTRIKIEKLRSKGVAMYAYSVSAYYACTGKQLISTWVEPSEMNANGRTSSSITRAASSPLPKKQKR